MLQLRTVVVSLLVLTAIAVLYLNGLKSANLGPIYRNIAELKVVLKNLSQTEEIHSAWLREYYTSQALARVKSLQLMKNGPQFSILYNVIVPEVQCPNLVRVGSVLDGGKFVCNPKAISGEDCRIYSFGIANEISFDQDIQNITGMRCRIYGYDMKKQSAETIQKYMNINGKIEVRTISNAIGHHIEDIFESNNDTFADILKIDIEGEEMVALTPFLSNKKYRVCQILVEMHGSAIRHLKLLVEIAK